MLEWRGPFCIQSPPLELVLRQNEISEVPRVSRMELGSSEMHLGTQKMSKCVRCQKMTQKGAFLKNTKAFCHNIPGPSLELRFCMVNEDI